MIIDGKKIAEEIVQTLTEERSKLPLVIRLGVIMSEGDKATESFIRIKERVADRLKVVIVREVLPPTAKTAEALRALQTLINTAQGIIVQLPLPPGVDVERVLAELPSNRDVDAIGKNSHSVLPPVAGAVKEILDRNKIEVKNKKAIIVGAGRLVGQPSTELLRTLGANVSIITTEQGSLGDLKNADIVVSGAGSPGMIKREMLKEGVVLIDAGTSEASGKVVGDADPACADVASVFTPVPGGIGPIAVAMIFKNLFAFVK